ncbi:MAG: nucleoside phosphorylase [Bacteroidetes bacterium]|nr:nucleoside phosphorylase [Bacteroidota bacterium]
MKKIGNAELILNPDGSIYHLHLKPGQLADTVIVVGDMGRVRKISRHFDSIEVDVQNRDFLTNTGVYKGKRLTVLSTGIGCDNIDIVLNELDALVNIDLESRTPYAEHKKLNIIRLGTSGALQADIPVDSFVVSAYGLGFDGLIHFYKCPGQIEDRSMGEAFLKFTQWPPELARPYSVKGSGIPATSPGFYGPQGRTLRMVPFAENLVDRISEFEYQGLRVVNFEMETSALFGLSRLMGHEAISVCVAVANRLRNEFSADYHPAVDKLIILLLERLVS